MQNKISYKNDKDLNRPYFTTGYRGQECMLVFNPLPEMQHQAGGGVYYHGRLHKMDSAYIIADGPNQGVGYRPS